MFGVRRFGVRSSEFGVRSSEFGGSQFAVRRFAVRSSQFGGSQFAVRRFAVRRFAERPAPNGYPEKTPKIKLSRQDIGKFNLKPSRKAG